MSESVSESNSESEEVALRRRRTTGHTEGDGHDHAAHDALADEVEEVVGDMIEGCFARPSGGCLCTVGEDEDGQ